MENRDLIEKVRQFKDEYYSKNHKNFFLKKKQKMLMAKQISNMFSLEELIRKTAFNIEGTNKIYLDYTVFKLYANETNYDVIVTYIMKIYIDCVEKYSGYEVHVNLDSLTPSAAERYKKCIELFNQATGHCSISNKLLQWYIYYPPSMIGMIRNILRYVIDPNIIDKFTVVPREHSASALKTLIETSSIPLFIHADREYDYESEEEEIKDEREDSST